MNRVPGVVVGIVKDMEDPKGEGRIAVQFPWLPANMRSGWAPIAAPLAGKGRGMFFMPEAEDEVLVAFEHGDFEHPFIIGFLWNGNDKPPETKNKNRVIKTPGGHQLRFEDGDPKKILISSAGGLQITMDDSAGGSITLQGGGRVLALKGGKVQIS